MILVQSETATQAVSIFVRNPQDVYNFTLTNQATKQAQTFDIPLVPTTSFDGRLEFDLPMELDKDTFYTLIARSNGMVENYSVVYSGQNLSQRYKRVAPMFEQPTKEDVLYKLPKK